ncbi:MAG: hypothetical protein ACKVOP_10955 [Sphingomonadaceae bacterium]
MKARSALILAASAAIALAPQAHGQSRERNSRVSVAPYLEIDQTVFGDLKGSGETLTYTTLATGTDTRIQTRRVELQLNYRYEYRFGWGSLEDSDLHSGIARGRFILVPNLLNFETGALATRTRADLRGDAFNPSIGNPQNVTQLYTAYAGPSIATQAGPFQVNAAYRFGYTKTEVGNRGVLLPGQPRLDVFDSSTSHIADASIGMPSGTLPFGWRASVGYEREDARQLDSLYEGFFARGDVTVPVTPTVALVGGVGYEDIEASQRDALRDGAGTPILDANGRFQTDPASPRRLAYDTDGLIWDTGVLWRPSRRTSAEFRVGRRYGSMTYVGSASYRPNDAFALQIGLYDGIQTFGRQVNAALASLPTQFTLARDPFGNAVSGCVYGVDGVQGGCIDGALQSVATGVYRASGVNAVLSYQRGPWQAGAGVGYARRRFFAPPGSVFSVDGVVDESVYAQAYLGRALDTQSGVDVSVYANWASSGIAGASDVLGTGATATYYRNFGPRLSGRAALGLYSTRIDGVDSSLTGAAQLGARYSF